MKAPPGYLKAFTIMETLVALVLTGLVIGLVYSGIRLVQRQGADFSARLDTFGQHAGFYHALQMDNQLARRLLFTDAGIDCIRPDGTIVSYVMADSLVVRLTDISADTFQVHVDSVAYWFGHQRQETPDTPVDAATVYIATGRRSLPMVIRKHYDAATLQSLTDTATVQ